jgi:hypothetical protein
MAYFNPITNEVLTKERQQMFLHQAEERHLFHLANAKQVRPGSGLLITIRNLVAGLSQRRKTVPAVCGDCGD